MSTSEISLETARALTLRAQGLLRPPEHPAGKNDVLAAIERNGVWQIDTINVVARSPYLALWSHLGEYSAAWLDELRLKAGFSSIGHTPLVLSPSSSTLITAV
jgi:uncharacterized protein YcaQ